MTGSIHLAVADGEPASRRRPRAAAKDPVKPQRPIDPGDESGHRWIVPDITSLMQVSDG
jgi:hypothetical protein